MADARDDWIAPEAARPPRSPRLRALRGGRDEADASAAVPSGAPLPAPLSAFETHEAVRVSPQRLEIRASARERAFAHAVLAAGVLLSLAGIVALSVASAPLGPSLASVAGGVLAAAGIVLPRLHGRVVLDAELGELRRLGGSWTRTPAVIERVAFADVASVQVLHVCVADDLASWSVWQVNLVRRDGSRVHVCPHVEESLARATGAAVTALLEGDREGRTTRGPTLTPPTLTPTGSPTLAPTLTRRG